MSYRTAADYEQGVAGLAAVTVNDMGGTDVLVGVRGPGAPVR